MCFLGTIIMRCLQVLSISETQCGLQVPATHIYVSGSGVGHVQNLDKFVLKSKQGELSFYQIGHFSLFPLISTWFTRDASKNAKSPTMYHILYKPPHNVALVRADGRTDKPKLVCAYNVFKVGSITMW